MFIKKLLKNTYIKVPLCVAENFIKRISYSFWKRIENSIFNVYDFGEDNKIHTQKLAMKIINYCEKYTIPTKGINFLELGPGAFLGVGAYMKKYGLKTYSVIDTINHFEKLDEHSIDLYNSIDDSLLKNDVLDDEYVKVLSYEGGKILNGDKKYEIIFSNAVYEHVMNPKESIKDLYRCTTDGGYGIHTIDYRDHIFGQDGITFLTIPDRIYRILFGESGARTNRKRSSDFRKYFTDAGFSIVEEVNEIVYNEELLTKNPKLSKKYGYDNLRIAASTFIVKK